MIPVSVPELVAALDDHAAGAAQASQAASFCTWIVLPAHGNHPAVVPIMSFSSSVQPFVLNLSVEGKATEVRAGIVIGGVAYRMVFSLRGEGLVDGKYVLNRLLLAFIAFPSETHTY